MRTGFVSAVFLSNDPRWTLKRRILRYPCAYSRWKGPGISIPLECDGGRAHNGLELELAGLLFRDRAIHAMDQRWKKCGVIAPPISVREKRHGQTRPFTPRFASRTRNSPLTTVPERYFRTTDRPSGRVSLETR